MNHKEIMDRYFKLVDDLIESQSNNSNQTECKEELTRFISYLAAKAAE